MRPFPILALLFLSVPLLEIFLFIQVGGWIGAWPTVGLVVLTAVSGAFLLRWQGLATLARVQASLRRGQLPARELVEGMLLVFGGALLLTPGFFTDAIGFLCLLPASRHGLSAWLLSRSALFVRAARPDAPPGGSRQPGPPPGGSAGGGRTLEGEYTKDEGGRTKGE